MGRLLNGITGPFVGKVGTVVGSSRHGKPYVKAKPAKNKKKTSRKKRTPNRSKFSAVHYWLQPLLNFVKQGYKEFRTSSGEFNAAKSYVMKNAVEGTAPAWSINPALVKLSTGDLPLPEDIAVAKAGTNTIEFTWATDKHIEGASGADQVMMMAYHVETRRAHMNTTGQFRRVGADTLKVEKGKTYHIYMAFTSSDREKQSESVYMGEIAM